MPVPSRSVVEQLRPLLASEAFGQLVRFAVAGVGVTILSVLIYVGAAGPMHVDPMIANLISHLAGVLAGYIVHCRWSFRVDAEHSAMMVVRFTIASGVAFALNSLWVWLAVHALQGPVWLPVPAMIFVTPLASFALNRWWVFSRV